MWRPALVGLVALLWALSSARADEPVEILRGTMVAPHSLFAGDTTSRIELRDESGRVHVIERSRAILAQRSVQAGQRLTVVTRRDPATGRVEAVAIDTREYPSSVRIVRGRMVHPRSLRAGDSTDVVLETTEGRVVTVNIDQAVMAQASIGAGETVSILAAPTPEGPLRGYLLDTRALAVAPTAAGDRGPGEFRILRGTMVSPNSLRAGDATQAITVRTADGTIYNVDVRKASLMQHSVNAGEALSVVGYQTGGSTSLVAYILDTRDLTVTTPRR